MTYIYKIKEKYDIHIIWLIYDIHIWNKEKIWHTRWNTNNRWQIYEIWQTNNVWHSHNMTNTHIREIQKLKMRIICLRIVVPLSFYICMSYIGHVLCMSYFFYICMSYIGHVLCMSYFFVWQTHNVRHSHNMTNTHIQEVQKLKVRYTTYTTHE